MKPLNLKETALKEEIKEILDRLERIDHKEYSCGFEFADSGSFDEDCRCFEERKKMANYITNLQQENQKYKEVGNTYKKRCQLAIEYIESKEYEYGDEEQDNYIYDIGFDEVNELLDILKGMK